MTCAADDLRMETKIHVQRIGGIWHGTIEGHPEIDERGLTEEIARRKVEDAARALAARRTVFSNADTKLSRRHRR
jgi:hypothetical protein